MRKFGVDKPELMCFTLGESDKVYTMPLAASCPAALILDLQESYKEGDAEALRFQIEMLRIYIGDVVDTLTAGDIRDIFIAWGAESSEQGAEPGESQASEESSESTVAR